MVVLGTNSLETPKVCCCLASQARIQISSGGYIDEHKAQDPALTVDPLVGVEFDIRGRRQQATGSSWFPKQTKNLAYGRQPSLALRELGSG